MVQPHVFVAKKILQRTGAMVPSGARVPYVFIEDLSKPDCLQAEKAEDPDYVREHDLPLDILYYVHHQLESPITALLELLVPDPGKAVFEAEEIVPLLHALETRLDQAVRVAKRTRKNVANNQKEITAFFKPVA